MNLSSVQMILQDQPVSANPMAGEIIGTACRTQSHLSKLDAMAF
jgi:hypothetical protein